MYYRILQALVEAKRNKESGLGSPLGRRGPKPVDGQSNIPTGGKAKSGAPEANKLSREGPSFVSTLSKMPSPGLIGGIPKVGQSKTTDAQVNKALMRARVKKNIAQSSAARAGSNFDPAKNTPSDARANKELQADIASRTAAARKEKLAGIRTAKVKRDAKREILKTAASAGSTLSTRFPNWTSAPTANAFSVGSERETKFRMQQDKLDKIAKTNKKQQQQQPSTGTQGMVAKLFSREKKSMHSSPSYKA